MRVTRGSTVRIASPVFVASDGETPTDCDELPTVTVTREVGDVLASPTAEPLGSGLYSVELTAADHTDLLDVLTVEWVGELDGRVQRWTQHVEVVGGHYASLVELRGEPGLPDAGRWPTTLLLDARDQVESYIEDYCGMSFVPRYAHDRLHGTGARSLPLSRLHPRRIRSITVNGEALNPDSCVVEAHGVVVRTDGTFPAPSDGAPNVDIVYEHGLDAPPPRLREEAIREIRGRVASSRMAAPTQALWQQVDGVVIRYATPDAAARRPTGNMQLDAALEVYQARVPGIA